MIIRQSENVTHVYFDMNETATQKKNRLKKRRFQRKIAQQNTTM